MVSKKRKILIFIDWFLPGYKAGGPVRSIANLISQLSETFDFKIVTRNTDYLSAQPYAGVASNCWVGFNASTQVFYFSEDNLTRQNLKKLIAETDFDVAYINGIYSFYFSILPLFLLKKKPQKLLVAARGMLSAHAFSAKRTKKKLFLTATKLLGLYKQVNFHATNADEATQIKHVISSAKGIYIAPNLPKKMQLRSPPKREKQAGTLKLVSIARISVEKNTLFALEMLAKGNFTGKIQFDLYGSIYRDDYWQACLQVIAGLPENISVNYKGSIDNSLVHSTFSNYHFALMPSKGENFGHSMLESMMAGCPLIISDKTPWRKLERIQAGWDIALHKPDKFVAAIQACIDIKQAEYNRFSENAFKFAKQFSNDKSVIEKTRLMFE